MKKIYLLFALIIATTGCEKDEIETFPEDEIPQHHQLLEIPFKDLPSSLTTFFKDRSTAKSPEGDFSDFFGSINVNMPAKKFISAEGEISYTFSLHNKITENSPSTFYFDNLVVYQRAEDRNDIYVIRYIPTDDWYETSKDFIDYTGEIAFYTVEGDLINRIHLENGEMLRTKRSSAKSGGACALELLRAVTICTNGGALEGDDQPEEYSCTTTYYYQLTCTSSGGIGDGFDDTESPEPGSLPRTGDGGYTPPTLPEEEEVKVVNEIDDPCASLIFGQLQLLSMDYGLPPDVSNPDNINEDIHFADAILNMFNDSGKFDYIVEDDGNFLNPNASASTDPLPVFNSETGRYEITTRFNTGYLKDATNLSIARTIIHESVHAYLVYQQKANPGGNLHEALLIYQRENEYFDSGNQIHHNFMAQFVNAMAYTLYKWDYHHGTGGNLGWQYYHDMAWGGLITDKYGNFWDEFLSHNPNQSDRDRIMDVIQDEANNSYNSSGNGNDCQ